MKIYRLDFLDANEEWRVKWFASHEEAISYQTEANRDKQADWDLEEFEIGESIGAVVGFLNYHAARINNSD